MNESRTQNSLNNIKTGIIVQIMNKLLAFFVRAIFIKCLSKEYLGINGLFTNILTMLSFTELGIGTAIIYSMYKPIAIDDKEKIKSLMQLYKKCYYYISIIVFILGLSIIPFMDFIIKEPPKIKENIIFIYFLFILNTSSTYIFSYKKSIIIAYQKQSIINSIDSIFYFIKSFIEILVLILFRNYLIYLIVNLLLPFIENVYLIKKANKMFPFIVEKEITKLDKKEQKSIFENVKSLIAYKFGNVILNGTDNILISSMIDVTTVGLCSNYTLIIQSVKSILNGILEAITASVGNLNAENDSEKKEKIFLELTFINYIVYSLFALVFVGCSNLIINLWLGNEYVLNIYISVALVVSLFIEGIRLPGYMYRTTMGLFKKGKASPFIASIANIFFSIILCKKFGVVGIFLGTSLAQIVSYLWIDPYIVYKYGFQKKINNYVLKMLKYFIIFSFNLVIIIKLYDFMILSDYWIVNILVSGLISFIIPVIINVLFFYNSEEAKSLLIRIKNIIKNKGVK